MTETYEESIARFEAINRNSKGDRSICLTEEDERVLDIAWAKQRARPDDKPSEPDADAKPASAPAIK